MPTIEERVALIEHRLGISYPISDPDGHVEGTPKLPDGPGPTRGSGVLAGAGKAKEK